MKQKKLMFLVHSLGGGGAEKVLIDLLKNLDPSRYEVTLVSVIGGVYEKSIPEYVKYKKIVKTKNKLLSKLFAKILFKMNKKIFAKLFLRGEYDFEIAYLEGNPTRQIAAKKSKSGKKIAFVHCDISKINLIQQYYKSKEQCKKEYSTFDQVCFVSNAANRGFEKMYGSLHNFHIVHNILDYENIRDLSRKQTDIKYETNGLKLISVGRLTEQKAYSRLLDVISDLEKKYAFELWILGTGEERDTLETIISKKNIRSVKLLGYQENPYMFIKQADLYICASLFEGYSTTVCEALAIGIPILTTDCAGMAEILGNSGCGIIVENSEKGIYDGLKTVLQQEELLVYLKDKAAEKSKQLTPETAINEYNSLFNA